MTKRTVIIISALICLLSISSCSKKKPEPLSFKRSVISGEIQNPSEEIKLLTVNYSDIFNIDKPRDVIFLKDTDGKFHIEREFATPQNVTIFYGSFPINVYVTPGDSVFVKILSDSLFNNAPYPVQYMGNLADENIRIYMLLRDFNNFVDYDFDVMETYEECLDSMRGFYKAVLEGLKKYSLDRYTTPFIRNFADKYYKYDSSRLVDMVYYYAPMTPEFYTESFYKINDESNFIVPSFSGSHLMVLAGSLLRYGTENPETIDMAAKLHEIQGFLAKKVTSDNVRDIVFYTVLYMSRNHPGLISLYESDQSISGFFASKAIEEKFRQAVIEKAKQDGSKNLILNGEIGNGITYLGKNDTPENVKTNDIVKHLANKHKGKVLYIDVWATWCPPCLNEMTYAPDLKNYYKSNDDVVFINLCLASASDTWAKALARYNVSGENYFFDEEQTVKFMTETQLNSYPSYLIVDKKGSLATRHAARPSEISEAITQIDNELNR